MTDDIARLKAALQADLPEPSEDKKAQAIALAEKKFAAHQGLGDAARLKVNHPEKRRGLAEGLRTMFQQFGLRQSLLATSGLAVAGLGVFLILPMNSLKPDFTNIRLQEAKSEKPKPQTSVEPMLVEEAELDQSASSLSASAPVKKRLVADQAMQEPVLGLILPPDDALEVTRPNSEQFANEAPNPLKITRENPVSTFSIDVDTASYAYIRSSIENGNLPLAEAVRIEEMINYFPYDYAKPADDRPFSNAVSVFQTPWNMDTKLVHIGIQGEAPALENRTPLDLVFLIDTSGSMQDANKLPLLKQSFRLLLAKLNPEDQVSIVTYAGSSGVVLEPTSANNRDDILAALNRLSAGGSTAGQAGLQLAYTQAEKMKSEGRIGRVLLATDGDFNVGISSPDALKTYIADKRDTGTYLSVLGFGRGNYNDALMQSLAQNGNGTASYIDTLSEAQKVLVDQVSGALFPIANDVKIQVEFNPAMIAEYRLIGYETRALAREDFNNDKVDAGDIGAGHSVTAIYEVTPVGSPAIMSDPLRYDTAEIVSETAELGFLKLRYKEPGQSESRLISTPIVDGNTATTEAQFSTAIAGFGQLLQSSKFLGDWGYADAIDLANSARGEDAFGYRHEAVNLMRLAASLAE